MLGNSELKPILWLPWRCRSSYNPSGTCGTLPCPFPPWIVPSTYLGPRCDLRGARTDLGKRGDDLDASPNDPRMSRSRAERVERGRPVARRVKDLPEKRRVEKRNLRFQCQVAATGREHHLKMMGVKHLSGWRQNVPAYCQTIFSREPAKGMTHCHNLDF